MVEIKDEWKIENRDEDIYITLYVDDAEGYRISVFVVTDRALQSVADFSFGNTDEAYQLAENLAECLHHYISHNKEEALDRISSFTCTYPDDMQDLDSIKELLVSWISGQLCS